MVGIALIIVSVVLIAMGVLYWLKQCDYDHLESEYHRLSIVAESQRRTITELTKMIEEDKLWS